MKVKNLAPRTLVIGGIPIESGKTRTLPNGTDISHFVRDGLIEVYDVQIKEGKHGTDSSD